MKSNISEKNILFISQVRLTSLDKVPGKAYHEARNWAKYFNRVVFLCFAEDEKYHYTRTGNFVIIAIPFNLSDSIFKTVVGLFRNYIRLLKYLFKIIRIFRIDIIREENLIIAGIPTMIVSRLLNVPYMTWLGGFERKSMMMKFEAGIATKILEKMIIILEYLIFRNSRMVFTVSRELYDLIGSRNVQNRFLTPNYVDFSIYKEKKYLGFRDKKKISILYSGRFEMEKGIDTL
ncbi:MAG: hypothetical protein ACTSRA_20910, partial [Promethearchaeota archaeon]